MHHIICHYDADGHASAAIYYHYLVRVKNVSMDSIRVHRIDYGMELPHEVELDIEYNLQGTHVAILDFTFEPIRIMQGLKGLLGDRLVWIDHHDTVVTAMAESPDLNEIKGNRRTHQHYLKTSEVEGDLISACELTWEYCHDTETTPRAIRLIGDWDTWRWKKMSEEHGELVKTFQDGLYVINTSMLSKDGRTWWMNLLEGYVYGNAQDCNAKAKCNEIEEQVLNSGRIIKEYQAKKWYGEVRSKAFEAQFLKYCVLMINSKGTSNMFDGFFDPDKHDFVVVYHDVQGKHLKVSLYSCVANSDIHLGVLAEVLGHLGEGSSGGGHKGAAGFITTNELFSKMYKRIGDIKKVKK